MKANLFIGSEVASGFGYQYDPLLCLPSVKYLGVSTGTLPLFINAWFADLTLVSSPESYFNTIEPIPAYLLIISTITLSTAPLGAGLSNT